MTTTSSCELSWIDGDAHGRARGSYRGRGGVNHAPWPGPAPAPLLSRRMLIAVSDLVRRWRGPRSRARDVDAVRTRIAAAANRGAGDEAVALAQELRALKPQVLAALREVRACSGCGAGRSAPPRALGRWILLRRAHRGSLRRARVGRPGARRHQGARPAPARGRSRRLRLPRPPGVLARRRGSPQPVRALRVPRAGRGAAGERRVGARAGADANAGDHLRALRESAMIGTQRGWSSGTSSRPISTCPGWPRIWTRSGTPARLWAVHQWTRSVQATLWEAVKGFRPVTLDDYVPPGVPSHVEVIHDGMNTLPAYNHFQKRFARPSDPSALRPARGLQSPGPLRPHGAGLLRGPRVRRRRRGRHRLHPRPGATSPTPGRPSSPTPRASGASCTAGCST